MNRVATLTRKTYFENHRGVSLIIALIAVALVLFQLYTAFFGSFDAYMQRALHLGFGLLLVFLISLQKSKNSIASKWLNMGLILASIAAIAYPLFRYEWIVTERFSLITPVSSIEAVLALLCILLVLEGTRRIAGTGLVAVASVFLLYPFIAPYLPGVLRSSPIMWSELLDFQYLGTAGIFGTAIGVSSTDIALYIVFGAVLVKSGGAELINNLAGALTGRSRGGPAKVAVAASSLMGTISGSGTSNVVTTGVVTIPMMKKTGYDSEFAAAVEAVASTGGQIMPPIMGAAAFVISAFAGIPYITIMKYALLPAILYYVGLYVAVHLRAIRLDLKGIETKVTVKETLKNYGHMVIPIFALIFTLVIGFTPRLAAGVAVITALVASEIRSTTRLGIWGIIDAFEDGAKAMLMVILATATAGLIVGVVDLTALGQRLGAVFVALGAGHLWLTLIMAAFLAILLGMGMPTTPAYIIQAATVIPALIQMGIPLHVAHMFAFYFSCLSLITPPVAISAYAAATIAKSDMWKTGWVAFRLGLPAYIVPFMFVYGESLLLVGSISEIAITATTAMIGVALIAVAGEGYLLRPLNKIERVVAFSAALLLIAPSLWSMIPGLFLAFLLVIMNLKTRKLSSAKVV